MAIVIMFIALITLFIGGVRLRYIASLLIFVLPMAVYLVISEPYRFRRIFSFLDPWSKAGADGYQAVQSLISIGSGQFFGLGFCASRQKLFYLPEPHTDFIFSVLGEEVGFLGASLVVLLFLVIMVAAMRMAVKTKDPLGRLLTISLTLMICIPAIVNIGMVLGLLPVAGIPLPFLSYGGSSLAVSLSAMGILCNVAYQNSKAKIKELTVPGSPGWIGN
jgi:cell division protein FtsW